MNPEYQRQSGYLSVFTANHNRRKVVPAVAVTAESRYHVTTG
jgi:hypothetical protein